MRYLCRSNSILLLYIFWSTFDTLPCYIFTFVSDIFPKLCMYRDCAMCQTSRVRGSDGGGSWLKQCKHGTALVQSRWTHTSSETTIQAQQICCLNGNSFNKMSFMYTLGSTRLPSIKSIAMDFSLACDVATMMTVIFSLILH